MDKESADNLANKVVDIFDGYALIPRDMTADDMNNLKNAKVELSRLFEKRF